MRFKEFLLREAGPRTENAGLGGAVKFFTENPSAFKLLQEKRPMLYRGMNTHDNEVFHMGDLRDFERKAAFTDNYVNIFLASSPEWKDVAKRTKSFICSNTGYGTMSYGTTYAVYPADDAKVSKCMEADFWDAFKGSAEASVNHWNMNIAQFRDEVQLSTTDASQLREGLTKMDKEFLEQFQSDKMKGPSAKFFLDLMEQFHESNVCDLMESVFEPSANGIETAQGKDIKDLQTTNAVEMWVEGPTFFIKMGGSISLFVELRQQILDAMQ